MSPQSWLVRASRIQTDLSEHQLCCRWCHHKANWSELAEFKLTYLSISSAVDDVTTNHKSLLVGELNSNWQACNLNSSHLLGVQKRQEFTVLNLFSSVNTTNEGTPDCWAPNEARGIVDAAPPQGPARPIDPIGKPHLMPKMALLKKFSSNSYTVDKWYYVPHWTEEDTFSITQKFRGTLQYIGPPQYVNSNFVYRVVSIFFRREKSWM